MQNPFDIEHIVRGKDAQDFYRGLMEFCQRRYYAIGDMSITRSGMVIIDHGSMPGMPGSGMHETVKVDRYDNMNAHTTVGVDHQSRHLQSNLDESLFNSPDALIKKYGVY
jgi:hypothetical protein